MDRLPTHDDANLILRLYELRREERMRQARKWFAADFYPQNLKELWEVCPPGSEANASMRMVASYWEMVASFITSGVLNEELFFQSGQELLVAWIRVRPFVDEFRAAFQARGVWKNLQQVAERYIEYLNRTAPGAYDFLVARMGTRPAPPATGKA